MDIECEKMKNGDLKIKTVGEQNRGKVYIGMHNMMDESE